MRYWILCLSSLLFGALFFACSPTPRATDGEVWSQLPSVTATDGYEQGVSAPFIGIVEGRVVVAGGCNFPGVPAAEGGVKRYYNNIYALDSAAQGWQPVGSLPQPLAYGASFTTPEGLVCAGGTDSLGRPTDGVYLLTFNGIKTLTSLPEPLDNCAGAYLDGKGYVVGRRSLYVYDFGRDRWTIRAMPDGRERRQAVCVAQGGRVWICGGYDPTEMPFSPTNYVYDPRAGTWEKILIPVNENGGLLAAGAAAVAWDEDYIAFFGGVNDSVFETALQRGLMLAADPQNDSLRSAQREYMKREPAWYRFYDKIVIYDLSRSSWGGFPESYPQCARAGAGAVVTPDNTGIVLFNGEVKPGVRTPEVWLWRP